MELLIPPGIRDLLRYNLLDETDLREFLDHTEREGMDDRPGWWRCRGLLPVRRALDPETSQLRRVEVVLRPLQGEAYEVTEIRGLDSDLT